jgi:hypothetical protein
LIQGSNQAKRSIITLVVLQEQSTRSYIGCPNDSKKIPDAIEGKEAVCPKCGQIVKPKALQWALFLVGDATDDIIASFPPSIMNRPSEGMIIVAQGLLGENEEFLVYRWTLPADVKAGATPEIPLQTFFKPVTAPPTTPPITAPTTATPVTATTATPVTATTATPSTTPSTALMCDQCNAGPFETQLALVGHKTATHAKKPVKRVKKPGVGSYTPVKPQTAPMQPPTTPPTGPTATPTATDASTETSPTEIDTSIDKGTATTATTAQTQPPTTAVIEPDSGAVKTAEHAEQATLTSIPTDQHAKDTATNATAMQPPMQPPKQPPSTATSTATQGTQAGAKEELKAIEGASLPSVKYARIAGLLAKSLNEFKLQFEASFPKDDMARAVAAANCTIVDGKVVFIGG